MLQLVTVCRKFLKGYVIYKGDQVSKTHNLLEVLEIAVKHDNSFKNIEEDCIRLNNYSSDIRYSSYERIEKHEVIDCIKALKNIYNFVPIKTIREEYIESGNYRINKGIEINEKAVSIIDNKDIDGKLNY